MVDNKLHFELTLVDWHPYPMRLSQADEIHLLDVASVIYVGSQADEIHLFAMGPIKSPMRLICKPYDYHQRDGSLWAHPK